MKKIIILIASILLIVCISPVMAHDSIIPPNANKAQIEENLFVGMTSDNFGLQRSCALMLGKIQSDRAVIPLINVLQNNANENMRIAAAWALCNIGDARGIDAVNSAVIQDKSTKVQMRCALYFENLVEQGTFTSSQPDLPAIAQTE